MDNGNIVSILTLFLKKNRIPKQFTQPTKNSETDGCIGTEFDVQHAFVPTSMLVYTTEPTDGPINLKALMTSAFTNCVTILEKNNIKITTSTLRIWFPKYMIELMKAEKQTLLHPPRKTPFATQNSFQQKNITAGLRPIFASIDDRKKKTKDPADPQKLYQHIQKSAQLLRKNAASASVQWIHIESALFNSGIRNSKYASSSCNPYRVVPTHDCMEQSNKTSTERLEKILRQKGATWQLQKLHTWQNGTGCHTPAVLYLPKTSVFEVEAALRYLISEFPGWILRADGSLKRYARYLLLTVDEGTDCWLITHPIYLRAFRALLARDLPHSVPLFPLIHQLIHYKPMLNDYNKMSIVKEDAVENVGIYAGICMLYRLLVPQPRGYVTVTKPYAYGFERYLLLDALLSQWRNGAALKEEIIKRAENPNIPGLLNGLVAFLRTEGPTHFILQNIYDLYNILCFKANENSSIKRAAKLVTLTAQAANKTKRERDKISFGKLRRNIDEDDNEFLFTPNAFYTLCATCFLQPIYAQKLFSAACVKNKSICTTKRTRKTESIRKFMIHKDLYNNTNYMNAFSTQFTKDTHPSTYLDIQHVQDPIEKSTSNYSLYLLALLETIYAHGLEYVKKRSFICAPYKINPSLVTSASYVSLAVALDGEKAVYFDSFFAVREECEIDHSHPLLQGPTAVLVEHLFLHEEYWAEMWTMSFKTAYSTREKKRIRIS